MVGISGGGGSGGGGYNYVQGSTPSDPTEGEEWYDTNADAAFVYDGSSWIEQTVVDYGQLTGTPTATGTTGPVTEQLAYDEQSISLSGSGGTGSTVHNFNGEDADEIYITRTGFSNFFITQVDVNGSTEWTGEVDGDSGLTLDYTGAVNSVTVYWRNDRDPSETYTAQVTLREITLPQHSHSMP